ncbi:MAG: Ig-like domain-containing protein [Gemmatimonadaceae bacterium]|jgi:hypothetical protein|nr:Ig-like domain-containing protein [Gemmatimonadaceae bacterium]
MPPLLRSLAPATRTRRADRRLRTPFTVLGALALSACGAVSDLLTPGVRNSDVPPAMLALRANVALAQTADGVALDVASSYVRGDGSTVPIGTQSLRLTAEARQQVPIPIDIATCLADPQRDGAAGSCAVMLNLALLVNGVVVDRQLIGPIRLTPGAPATVAAPVTLFELTELRLLDGEGRVLEPNATLSMAPSTTRALRARLRDSRGSDVTDRAITWQSDAPQVASVSSTGIVTAIAEGTARITASNGALSASTTLTVVRPPVSLTVRGASGSGRGVVRSTPSGIECRVDGATLTGTCSATFAAGASVTLQSVPDARTRFAAWGEACATAGTNASCIVSLASAREVTAGFDALRTVSVAAGANSDGRGRIVGSGLDCALASSAASGTCSLDVVDGTTITVEASTASATALQRFAGWSAPCADAQATRCTVTVRGGDLQLAAQFFDARRLEVTPSGTGSGVIRGLPDAICTLESGSPAGDCAATVLHGSTITLTASADARSQFTGWSGACSGTSPTCTVTLTQARAVSATFGRRRVTLSVRVAGPGDGVVRLDGALFCAVPAGGGETVCTREVDAGTRVLVRGAATADFSRFEGFTQACTGVGDCELVLDQSANVRAQFSVIPVRVEVASGPTVTGSGRVQAVGIAGLDCAITLGSTAATGCAASVNPFTPVTLTATSAPASALVSWGDACAGATTVNCTLSPSTAVTRVTAQFSAAIDVDLIVNAVTGAGTVRFEIPNVPTQTACTAAQGQAITCRYALPIGTTGIFRAEPAPGRVFLGFSGPCLEGTSLVPTCTYRGFGFVREIQAFFTVP